MASDAGREPLLRGASPETTNREVGGKAARKRRFRRVRSAPHADFCDTGGATNNKPTDSPLPGPLPISVDLPPSFRKVVLLLAVYLGVGTLCFSLTRNQIAGERTEGVLDAVYFMIVTMTTVGYGDLVPDSVLTKLLACAFVFSGMTLVSQILSRGADYLMEKQETLLVKAMRMRQRASTAEIMEEIQTKRVRYKCYITFVCLLVLIVAGTTFLATVEKLRLVDSFYCVCSTISTLGYGDKSFSTKGGRIFAVFWILTSTICLAQFLLYLAELNTENRQRKLVRWVLTRKMTSTDLEAADVDADGVVGAADFIVYKLKEMGKISEEDISLVMEEFEQLDLDESGTLTNSDITQAQLSEATR